jgi:hypothetical protein
MTQSCRSSTNLGGVILMQVLPFYDGAALRVLQGFEERVYKNLR